MMVQKTFSRLNGYLAETALSEAFSWSIQNTIQAVTDLDLSLTKIRKVSDLSGESLHRFVDRAFEAASQIGRSGKDLIDAAAEFRRAGYELESSFELGRAALVMANVGDGIESVDDASSALIATLRGFHIAESAAMSVVDAVNEVSNTAAISFKDLTEGMQYVSGAMSQSGMDMAQTMGLLTGGFAKLKDISLVADELITISNRFHGISDAGDEIAGLAPKLQNEFKKIAGVDIAKPNGELRSMFHIFNDLAAVFPDLTKQEQQYLNTLAGGSSQSNVLQAILQNWSDVEIAVNSANNSAGSALKKNSEIMDSIEGKTRQFQASFQKLANSVVDSGLVKFFLDAGNAVFQFLAFGDGFAGKIITWVAAAGSLSAAFNTLKNNESVTNFFKGIGSHCKSCDSLLGMLPDSLVA